LIGVPRDARIPESVTNMSAGYTPGIPRLGLPALQSSDASMGVTNPGYRPDDKGATAFPASIVGDLTSAAERRSPRRLP
jgi:beta-glucosidase